jgi:hypothetical protein
VLSTDPSHMATVAGQFDVIILDFGHFGVLKRGGSRQRHR